MTLGLRHFLRSLMSMECCCVSLVFSLTSFSIDWRVQVPAHWSWLLSHRPTILPIVVHSRRFISVSLAVSSWNGLSYHTRRGRYISCQSCTHIRQCSSRVRGHIRFDVEVSDCLATSAKKSCHDPWSATCNRHAVQPTSSVVSYVSPYVMAIVQSVVNLAGALIEDAARSELISNWPPAPCANCHLPSTTCSTKRLVITKFRRLLNLLRIRYLYQAIMLLKRVVKIAHRKLK